MADASLGLFENERETNLESTEAVVEDVLVDMGHFVNDARVHAPFAIRSWSVQSNGVALQIALVHRDDFVHLRAAVVVMTITSATEREKLFQRILELNGKALCGIAFALEGNQIRLVAERSTRDLDRSEVHALLDQLVSTANEHSNALVAEFAGILGEP